MCLSIKINFEIIYLPNSPTCHPNYFHYFVCLGNFGKRNLFTLPNFDLSDMIRDLTANLSDFFVFLLNIKPTETTFPTITAVSRISCFSNSVIPDYMVPSASSISKPQDSLVPLLCLFRCTSIGWFVLFGLVSGHENTISGTNLSIHTRGLNSPSQINVCPPIGSSRVKSNFKTSQFDTKLTEPSKM